MDRSDIAIARYANHTLAENAVKSLAQAGFDMTQLSVIGRGYHTEDKVIGFYNSLGRIQFWGRYGAFWGALWGLFSGGIFITIPAIGPIVALGAISSVILSSLEGALIGGGLSALGAALFSIGVPKDSIIEYERTLAADGFLVSVLGSSGDVARARSILKSCPTNFVDIHEIGSRGALVVANSL